MSRNRTAALVLSITLAFTTSTFAAPPRSESGDLSRDSVIARALRNVKRLIVRILAEPQSPPPTNGQ